MASHGPKHIALAVLVFIATTMACSAGPDTTTEGLTESFECPTTFDTAMGVPCFFGRHDGCDYPEGSCYCSWPTCSGIERRPPEVGTQGILVCAPHDPAYPRADGCPTGVPVSGEPCDGAPAHCGYESDCGGESAIAQCSGNTWTVETYPAPEPM